MAERSEVTRRAAPRTGAVNLNVHFHSLFADGVWVERPSGHLAFVPVRVRDADVEAVVRTVERKVRRMLVRSGRVALREDGSASLQVEADPDRAVEAGLVAASAQFRTATGRRAGRPLRRLGVRPRKRTRATRRRRESLQAEHVGFDLHAKVRVGWGERKQLEHLCRYLLRPALATERLSLRPDGRYEYRLRRPWADGTTAFVYEPVELMERLAALVPMPRANLVRYHGVFAPAAEWRGRVVPAGDRSRRPPRGGFAPKDRVPWAQLLHRVWLTRILVCAGCGGRRELVAQVTEPFAIRRILEHLGLDPSTPGPVPARGPPEELQYAV